MSYPPFESIPLEARQQVAQLAAEVIEQAASFRKDCWGMTPYSDAIRINVGWTEILTARPEHLRLIVNGKPARDAGTLPGVTIFAGSDSRGFYPTIPGSVCVEIVYQPTSHFEHAMDALRPALSESIRLAARRQVGRGVKAGHRQEAVEALAVIVGRHLPTPGFVLVAEQASAENVELMEGASHRVVSSQYERNPDILSRRAYLFLWNPAKDPHSFNDYDRVLADARAGCPYDTRWICPSKQPTKGDLAFVQRTGPRNNGVFARGLVTHGAHLNRGTQVVRLSLDAFLPVGQEISRQQIVDSANYERPWMPMSSGNALPESLVQAIDSLWASADTADSRRVTQAQYADETPSDELAGLEGRALQRLIVHRHREQFLRDRKIQDTLSRTKKLACEVPECRFDFAEVYGQLGVGYAQVHHLWPLAERDDDRPTTLADLAIVCANCHAMIHRGGNCHALATLIPQQSR